MEEDVLTLPVLIKIECPSVLTGIVVLVSRNRRHSVIVTVPCVAYILIDGVSIAIELPHAGNRHFIPVRVGKISLVEIHRTRRYGLIPAEFPHSAQGELQASCAESCSHRFPVLLHNLWVMPVRHLAGPCIGSRSA